MDEVCRELSTSDDRRSNVRQHRKPLEWGWAYAIWFQKRFALFRSAACRPTLRVITVMSGPMQEHINNLAISWSVPEQCTGKVKNLPKNDRNLAV